MKKTIQINIAGIVFNIEEDAYEKLRAYLAAIQQYFSKYEDSREITTDIENRIAEKFFDKQKATNNSAITSEHVNQVIQSMGTVADFQAIEEEEDLAGNKKTTTETNNLAGNIPPKNNQENSTTNQDTTGKGFVPHKFFRDTKHKVLGGVLAGFANHYKIDVVWIRLIFLILFIGIPPMSNGDLAGISGVLFIAYMVCWIAFPGNNNLEEDTKIKKFYRNPDQKVIGGVASGLSAYFGIDLGIVRFLFVVAGFAGIGIISYILLWIVAPKATTLTQKMEMKGEPVTLSNIETNIKSSLQVNPNAPETEATKLLLFPFRALAVVLSAMGQVFKSLGPVVRVFAGIILLIISIAWTFAAFAGAGVFFSLVSQHSVPWIHIGDVPVHFLSREVSPLMGVFGFLVFVLPAFAIGIIGASLIANRSVSGNRSYWITGLGLWLISLLSFGAMTATYALNFSKEGNYQTTKSFPINNKTLVFDALRSDSDFLNNVNVSLEGYDGKDLKAEQNFSSQGSTSSEADKNAENVLYKINQKDSTWVFSSDISLTNNAKFRRQRLEMKLYIPYNQPFTMTGKFVDELLENNWDLLHEYDLDAKNVAKYQFVMKKDTGIVCLNCLKKKDNDETSATNNDADESNGIFANSEFNDKGEHERTFSLNNFTKIEIGSAFVVNVKKGNNFSVSVDGDNQNYVNDVKAKVENNTLKVYFENGFSINENHDKRLRVNITMPKLEYAELSGATLSKIENFNDRFNNNEVTLHISGASKVAFQGNLSTLNLEESGASEVELLGVSDKVKASFSGASTLDAKGMKINEVDAEANGASNAKFGHVKNFHSNTSGASSIVREE